MKNLLTILLFIISLTSNGQPNNVNYGSWTNVQSTAEARTYTGTANLLIVQSTNKLLRWCIGCTTDTIRGKGRIWKILNPAKQDSMWRVAGEATIHFTIDGREHTIIDSTGEAVSGADGNGYTTVITHSGVKIIEQRNGMTDVTSNDADTNTTFSTIPNVLKYYDILRNKTVTLLSNNAALTIGATSTQTVGNNPSYSFNINPASIVAQAGGITGTITLTANGDATGSGNGTNAITLPLTLATVNANTGTWGDGTHVPQFVVNGKGLMTSVNSVAISFPVTTRDRFGYPSEDVTLNEARAVNGNHYPFLFDTLSRISISAATATKTTVFIEGKDSLYHAVYAGLSTSTYLQKSDTSLTRVYTGTSTSTWLATSALQRVSVFSGASTSTISINKDSITFDAAIYKIKNLTRNTSGTLKMQVYDTAAKIIYYQDIPTLSGGADVYATSGSFSAGTLTINRNDGNHFDVALTGVLTSTPDLQAVTNVGATTSNNITIGGGSTAKLTLNAATPQLVFTGIGSSYQNRLSSRTLSSTDLDFYLPNAGGGTLVRSVNGNAAGNDGDVTLSDTNFFNTDLTQTGTRNHNAAHYPTYIEHAVEFSISAEGTLFGTSWISNLDVDAVSAHVISTNQSNGHQIGVVAGPLGVFVQADEGDVTIGASLGNVYVSNLGTGTVYSNSGRLTNTNPSDARLKNSIENLPYGSNELRQLNPVQFYYNSDSKKENLTLGLIAQNVQQVLPSLVKADEKGFLGIKSDQLLPLVIQGWKEHDARIDQLEKQVEILQDENRLLKKLFLNNIKQNGD